MRRHKSEDWWDLQRGHTWSTSQSNEREMQCKRLPPRTAQHPHRHLLAPCIMRRLVCAMRGTSAESAQEERTLRARGKRNEADDKLDIHPVEREAVGNRGSVPKWYRLRMAHLQVRFGKLQSELCPGRQRCGSGMRGGRSGNLGARRVGCGMRTPRTGRRRGEHRVVSESAPKRCMSRLRPPPGASVLERFHFLSSSCGRRSHHAHLTRASNQSDSAVAVTEHMPCYMRSDMQATLSSALSRAPPRITDAVAASWPSLWTRKEPCRDWARPARSRQATPSTR